MAIITYKRPLDMVPGTPAVPIYLSQYDEAFTLELELFARDGQLTIPQDATAKIRGTKRDGNVYEAEATIAGGIVTVTGNKQMTAVAGKAIYEIVLYEGDKELSSANFVLMIENAAADKTTIPSESVIEEIEIATQKLAELEEQLKAMQSSVTEAATKATEAKTAADTAATKADTAEQKAKSAEKTASGLSSKITQNTNDIGDLQRDYQECRAQADNAYAMAETSSQDVQRLSDDINSIRDYELTPLQDQLNALDDRVSALEADAVVSAQVDSGWLTLYNQQQDEVCSVDLNA